MQFLKLLVLVLAGGFLFPAMSFGGNEIHPVMNSKEAIGYKAKSHSVFFEIDQILDRKDEDFRFYFADNVENFTDFPIGTVIATDGEREIKILKQGEAIIFPNANVAIGQRALLTVIPVEVNPI